MSVLASEIGTTTRTLRRWISERPELRPALRVYRKGTRWRLAYPATQNEWEDYVSEVRAAIEPFRRNRRMQLGSALRRVLRDCGHRTPKLEIGINLLRHAMWLKWLRLERPLSRVEWLEESSLCFGAARMVMQQNGKALGNDIRKARPLLDRLEKAWREKLLRWWPDEEDWGRASRKSAAARFKDQNLFGAMVACLDAGMRLSGPNLAPLMFRNQRHMDACFLHTLSASFSGVTTKSGESIFLPVPPMKPGISLRTFRSRYDADDLRDKAIVICGAGSADVSPTVSVHPRAARARVGKFL